MPEQVLALESCRVTQISAGGYHTVAVTEESEIYAWGSSKFGECGNGQFGVDISQPQLVKLPAEKERSE